MLALYGIALGIGLALGLAVLGGGIGQGLAANGAMQGMARQPEMAGKIQTGMIIALAFVESLILFTLLIAFLMIGKLPTSADQVIKAESGGAASYNQPMDKQTQQNPFTSN